MFLAHVYGKELTLEASLECEGVPVLANLTLAISVEFYSLSNDGPVKEFSRSLNCSDMSLKLLRLKVFGSKLLFLWNFQEIY